VSAETRNSISSHRAQVPTTAELQRAWPQRRLNMRVVDAQTYESYFTFGESWVNNTQK